MMTSSVAEHLFASNVITDEMRQQNEAEKPVMIERGNC